MSSQRLITFGILLISALALGACNKNRNAAPVADFGINPSEPHAGIQATFDASASYDPDGEIVSYKFEFGDGSVVEGVDALFDLFIGTEDALMFANLGKGQVVMIF